MEKDSNKMVEPIIKSRINKIKKIFGILNFMATILMILIAICIIYS